MSRIESFPPLIGTHPKILILGSMPGEASLQAQQYYAHPRNQFWRIISHIFSFPENLEYAARTEMFQKQPLALWDVLQSCIRPGSLDSAIAEEHPNALAEFLTQHPSITSIAFNGQAAGKLFKKHIKISQPIDFMFLPSTSPAHAGMTFEKKLEIWQSALTPR